MDTTALVTIVIVVLLVAFVLAAMVYALTLQRKGARGVSVALQRGERTQQILEENLAVQREILAALREISAKLERA
jgi:flagellar basal body-associated protein FliL